MKRLLAILLFIAGGFATELTHPLSCSLMQAQSQSMKRRKERTG
jgi:hypothetical protein